MSNARVTACLLLFIMIFSFFTPSIYAEESGIEVIETDVVPTEEVAVDDSVIVDPSPTVTASAPTITKHPEPETVLEGESCIFVAKASNYDWISWYFVKGDKDIVYMQDAEAKFPGLEIKGYLSTVLTLNNVPIELNGWRVGALFGNSAGKSGTTTCTITVTAKPKPSAQPTPTVQTAAPTPIVTASPVVTPSVTTAPVVTPAVQSVPSANPITVQTVPEPTEDNSGSLSSIIVFAVLIFVIIFAAGSMVTLYILNRKGIIDLESLFTNRKNRRH